MIIEVSLSTGWTVDAVEDWLNWDRLKKLRSHWRKHPPLQRLVESFVGFSAPAEAVKPASFEQASEQNADWFADPSRFFKPDATLEKITVEG